METIKLLAIAIQLISFFWYTIFIYSKYGIQKSISQSYYCLEDNYFFSLFTWGISLPLFIFSFDPFKPLFVLAIILISFIGVFAEIKKKIISSIHYICAVSGIIIAFFAINIYFTSLFNLCLTGAFITGSGIFYLKSKNWIWWMEYLAFIGIITVLFINVYK